MSMPGQSPFRKGKCLILVRSPHMRGMVRDILASAAITESEFLPDSDAVIMNLRYGAATTFVMCEATEAYQDHLKISKFIRWETGPFKVNLPIISFGEKWTVTRLTEARDAGVSEIIALPVTMHGFMRRIISAVCQERPFIMSESYRGPDRRKRSDPSYVGALRRTSDHSSHTNSVHSASPTPSTHAATVGAATQTALLNMLERNPK